MWYKHLKAYVAGAEAHFDNSGDAVAHRGSDGTASGVMSSLKNTFSFYKAKVAEKVSDTMGISTKGLRQQQSLDFEDDVMFVTEKATTRRVSQQSAGSRHSGGLDHGKKSRGKVKRQERAAAEGSSSAASPRQHAEPLESTLELHIEVAPSTKSNRQQLRRQTAVQRRF